MARIFNIYFHYDGAEHSAIVLVKDKPFFTEYNLSLPEVLLHQLPSAKIIGTPSGQLLFQPEASGANAHLMRAIIEAITRHLNLSTVSS